MEVTLKSQHRSLLARRAAARGVSSSLLTVLMSAFALPLFPAERKVPSDYSTIQEAVNSAAPRDRILIAPGIYRESVVVTVQHIEVVGTGATSSDVRLVSEQNYFALAEDGEPVRWGALALWAKADMSLSNLTIENVFDEPAARAAGLRAHTPAARFEGRVLATNVRFVGWSDVLSIQGHGQFNNVLVVGSNDFVFGKGSALFVDSEFFSKTRGAVFAQGGEVGTAFTVLDSEFNGADGVEFFLARPLSDHSTVVIRNSYIGSGALPVGFSVNEPHQEAGSFFYECENRGPGSDLSARAPWAHHCSH